MTTLSETNAVDRRNDGGGASAPSPSVRRRRLSSPWRKRLEILLLAGPALVLFAAFVIFPVIIAAYYGFFSWAGYGPATDFVGLRNYTTILGDQAFRDALWHNIVIIVLSLLIQGPVALGLALLLNRKMRFQSAMRILIFIPYVISEVVVGTGWALILASGGALNSLLAKLHLESLQQDWLANPNIAIFTLMAIVTWKYIGFAVILFLAGMQGIPEELTEAAAIDGASYWQIQRRITVPLLAPTLRIWAFLSIIGSLQLFDLVYIIWGPYVAGTAGTSTMATYMVLSGRNAGSYGYGNAVAVVIFIVSLIIALTYQRLVLRRDNRDAVNGVPR